MKLRRSLTTGFLAAVLGLFVSVAPTQAAPITFATVASHPGLPQIILDAATLNLTSNNVVTPYDPADPFYLSSPGTYTLQVPLVFGPLSAVLQLDSTSPDGIIDPTTTSYGPSSFRYGIDLGALSFAWIAASFADATLSLAADLSGGIFYNIGSTTYSGVGFDFTGLQAAGGSFAFNLGNPTFYRDANQALLGIGYEITSGVLVAESELTTVPEPASMLLLGVGLLGVGYGVRAKRTRG